MIETENPPQPAATRTTRPTLNVEEKKLLVAFREAIFQQIPNVGGVLDNSTRITAEMFNVNVGTLTPWCRDMRFFPATQVRIDREDLKAEARRIAVSLRDTKTNTDKLEQKQYRLDSTIVTFLPGTAPFRLPEAPKKRKSPKKTRGTRARKGMTMYTDDQKRLAVAFISGLQYRMSDQGKTTGAIALAARLLDMKMPTLHTWVTKGDYAPDGAATINRDDIVAELDRIDASGKKISKIRVKKFDLVATIVDIDPSALGKLIRNGSTTPGKKKRKKTPFAKSSVPSAKEQIADNTPEAPPSLQPSRVFSQLELLKDVNLPKCCPACQLQLTGIYEAMNQPAPDPDSAQALLDVNDNLREENARLRAKLGQTV